MVTLVPYQAFPGQSLQKALQNFDYFRFLTVTYHQDIFPDSVTLAIEQGKVVGVAYLKAAATFLCLDRDLPYYFMDLTVAVDKNHADAEALHFLLLEEEKKFYEKQRLLHPGKRIILRSWCDGQDIAGSQQCLACGLRPMRVIPIMVKRLKSSLSKASSATPKESCLLADGSVVTFREIEPHDPSVMKAYLAVNETAFHVADSANDLLFTMGAEDAHVYAAYKEETLLACVTTWKLTPARAATENIFCDPRYHRKGCTSALLSFVFHKLQQSGYEEASLTVFGDNQPAVQLYRKIGYQLEGFLHEYHYETDYTPLGF